MSAFELDTSGHVAGWVPPHGERAGYAGPNRLAWSDLDPFTRGYVEALFAANVYDLSTDDRGPLQLARFSDLAPETLARIVEDCAAYQASEIAELCNAAEGRWFWNARNLRDDLKDFPALTVSLGDDGKVYLREAA